VKKIEFFNNTHSERMSQPKAVVDQRVIGNAPDGNKYVTLTLDPRVNIEQFMQRLQEAGDSGGIAIRVCDGCHRAAGSFALECACANPKCLQHFDLCSECEPKFKHDVCPAGFGCGNIN
jgi:hypothetical protein